MRDSGKSILKWIFESEIEISDGGTIEVYDVVAIN
jgi:hypothetical protein